MATKEIGGESVVYITKAPIVERLPNRMVRVRQPGGCQPRLMSRAVYQECIFDGMRNIREWDEEEARAPTSVVPMGRRGGH